MFHKIPGTFWTIGYFPKGPIPDASMIRELITLGKQKNAIFIQIEPNVLSSYQLTADSYQLLQPSHHPLFPKYTFVLDLTKSEDELLKAMHPKTRYNIRIAQKHGVTIQEEKNLNAFLKLNNETLKRQKFYAHNDLYYQRLWQYLHPKIAKQFTARYRGTVIAAWIIFCYGDTIYYPYGASSREHREVMAASFLLWKIAIWGKSQGYKKFDLWGALGPNLPAGKAGPDPKDPWFGFHRFKNGFGPDLVEFVGSYDLVLKPMLYQLYSLADKLRWAYLRMRR